MGGFAFFYADIEASLALLNQYDIDDWVHASNGVVASGLRGGLLSGCNIRFSFLPIAGDFFYYRQEDLDYKNLRLFIFPVNHYFRVLDKYQINGKAQILMTNLNDIESEGLDDIIRAARNDFMELSRQRPVDILNTPEWKRRVAMVPGMSGEDSAKKGFRTDYR